MINKEQIELKLIRLKKELEVEKKTLSENIKTEWYGSAIYNVSLMATIKSQINILNWVLQNEEGVLNDRSY